MSPTHLTASKINDLHGELVDRYGGNTDVRDPAALEKVAASLAASPATGSAPDVLASTAAHYLCSILEHHPFVDGNRRTALAAALYFLEMNGVELIAPDHILAEMVISVAEKRCKTDVLRDFFRNSIPNDAVIRPVEAGTA